MQASVTQSQNQKSRYGYLMFESWPSRWLFPLENGLTWRCGVPYYVEMSELWRNFESTIT